jgi:hypothetical protein
MTRWVTVVEALGEKPGISGVNLAKIACDPGRRLVTIRDAGSPWRVSTGGPRRADLMQAEAGEPDGKRSGSVHK